MSNNNITTLDWKHWSLLLLLAFLWGCSFFFIEVALIEIPPLTLVALRLVFAALALHIILFFMGKRIPTNPRLLLMFLIMGGLNNFIPFTLITYGQVYISSSLASIYNATTPLCTAVVAHLLTSDEKMNPLRAIGVCIGFSGVAIMVGTETLFNTNVSILAQLAVLVATVSYGFASVFGRQFYKQQLSPIVIATGQVTFAAIMLLPIALIIERPWHIIYSTTDSWLAVIVLAFFSTSCAYIIYFKILEISGSTRLSLVTFLVPIVTIILGITILKETLTSNHIFGMLLIGLSLILIDNGMVKKWKRCLK